MRQLQGEREAAAEDFPRALELDPSNVPALHLAGLFWLEHGQNEHARALLERAAQRAPGDERLQTDLARASD